MNDMKKHYDAYLKTINDWNEAKDQLKDLRVAGETMAKSARKNTVGTNAEKLLAIQVAWLPYQKAIAEKEQEIGLLRNRADDEWNAYDKARIEA